MPDPTITAVGVARPRAQGQATTRVEIPNLKAKLNLSWSSLNSGESLVKAKLNQIIQLRIARATIVGTNIFETLSANP
jgi:hypothetical protein